VTRYAESILDVGVHPLRRRDRASLTLALECLREEDVHVVAAVISARRSLSEGGDVACQVLAASNVASAHEAGRLVRSRFALLLRCLLRVDKRDFGPVTWWPWIDADGSEVRAPVQDDDPCYDHLPIRPLWQDAPGGQR
jgi:hypothetical protein